MSKQDVEEEVKPAVTTVENRNFYVAEDSTTPALVSLVEQHNKSSFLSWKVAGIAICSIVVGYALSYVPLGFHGNPSNITTPEGLAAMPDSAVPLNPGPWGNLEALPIYIEPPDEYLPVQAIGNADNRWHFTGISVDQLLALFRSADLTPEQRATLSDTSQWHFDQNSIVLNPPRELVLSLSPAARKQIYWPMVSQPGNILAMETVLFPTDQFGRFFADSGLPDETIALIKKLSFPYGRLTIFSDLHLVLDTLPDPEQKKRLLKTVMKKSTLLLRLHITPRSNLPELEHYWIKAGWGLDLRPMFESLQALHNGARVDVVELLPPIPASKIYTYAFPSLKPEDQHKDCRWTALNFFRDTPDDRFVDPKVVMQTLDTDYYPVQSDARYGDLILLTNTNGEIIHIAVYIADDIVYTKNSGSSQDPYILMKIPEMLDHFAWQLPEDQKITIQVRRNKYY